MFGKLVGLQTSLLVPDEKTYSVVVIVGGHKQKRFRETHVNRKWAFCIVGQLLCLHLPANRPF